MAFKKSAVAKNPNTAKEGAAAAAAPDDGKAEKAHQRRLAKRTVPDVGMAFGIIATEAVRLEALRQNPKVTDGQFPQKAAACTKRMNKAFRKLVLRPAEIDAVMHAFGLATKRGEPLTGIIKTW